VPAAPTVRHLPARRAELEARPIRWLGAAMLALGAALPHVPGNPGIPCPLRALTGVPCPLCGMTTSVKATLHADLHAAASANPFGMLAVVVAVVLLVRPGWRRLEVPVLALLAAGALSWVFELHRYHFL
jgi:hypothetical protein